MRTTGAASLILVVSAMVLNGPLFPAAPLDDQAWLDLVNPTVVQVFAEGASGSGFVVSVVSTPDRMAYVATNHHVVEGSGQFVVAQDGQHAPAELIWSDPDLDLALLRTNLGGLEPLVLAVSPPRVLSDVTSVGFPAAADIPLPDAGASDPTLTEGNVGRRIQRGTWNGRRELRIVQHSAQINPGNSGGPLIDACGRVVGVNTSGPRAMLIRTPAGDEVQAPTGVFFASFIAELADSMESEGYAYESATDSCEAPLAVGPGVAAREAEDLARRIEELEGSLETQNAQERAATEERLAQLDGQLDELLAGASSEPLERWLATPLAVAFAVVVLASVVLFGFASLRTSMVEAVARVGRGASHVVRSRRSRVASVPARQQARSLHIRVGRGRDVDVRLDSSRVSRLHAELEARGRRYVLTDHRSTNGTRVFRDGAWQPVHRESVGGDEQLELGDYRTTAKQLMTMASSQDGHAVTPSPNQSGSDDRPAGPVRRDARGRVVPN